jgi:DNA-binding CsgD family transcriptional regulator
VRPVETRSEFDAIDAVICLVLQHRPHATAFELSPVVTAVTDEEVSQSLERLQADGLVQVIDGSSPTSPRYAAKVAPETAAEMLTRRTRINRPRPPSALCRTPPVRLTPEGAPEVLSGPDEIRRVVDGMQRGARREVLCVDKPPYAAGHTINLVERDRLLAGVSYRVIYDRSALSGPGRLDTITELVDLGEQARTACGVPMKMMIFDRVAAVIPLQVGTHTIERSLLVRQSSLVSALAKVFADLWQAAVPFAPAGPAVEPAADGPSSEERQILALLAAGATDDSIGRLMGFSPRTAHRRVRELAAKLGVETRFQAGVQAVRLGWL